MRSRPPPGGLPGAAGAVVAGLLLIDSFWPLCAIVSPPAAPKLRKIPSGRLSFIAVGTHIGKANSLLLHTPQMPRRPQKNLPIRYRRRRIHLLFQGILCHLL